MQIAELIMDFDCLFAADGVLLAIKFDMHGPETKPKIIARIYLSILPWSHTMCNLIAATGCC